MTTTDTEQVVDLLPGQGWMTKEQADALRLPFPAEQIGRKPQNVKRCCVDATKAGRNECADGHKKATCRQCHGYHFTSAMHNEYVGHAEVTNRLLQVDPEWTWEPMAVDEHGMPLLDRFGGLWIRLTICGVTKPGYGESDDKNITAVTMKSIISDSIKIAAMRFGVGLDLWSKSEGALMEADKNGALDQPQPRPEPEPNGRVHGQNSETPGEMWKRRTAEAIKAGKPGINALWAEAKAEDGPAIVFEELRAAASAITVAEQPVQEPDAKGEGAQPPPADPSEASRRHMAEATARQEPHPDPVLQQEQGKWTTRLEAAMKENSVHKMNLRIDEADAADKAQPGKGWAELYGRAVRELGEVETRLNGGEPPF